MSTAVKKDHKSARPARGGPATLVEAIRQGIWEEMERDPTVFVIGEDVGAYGGAFKVTDGLIDEFGRERVVDTPISEGAIVGAACGAALMGMRPVADAVRRSPPRARDCSPFARRPCGSWHVEQAMPPRSSRCAYGLLRIEAACV